MLHAIFEDRINYWKRKNPVYKSLFGPMGRVCEIIESVDQILEIFENAPETELLNVKTLTNFIDGLAMIPLIEDDGGDTPTAEEAKILTLPVFDFIRKVYSVDGLKKYFFKMEMGEAGIMKTEGGSIPIHDKFKKHVLTLVSKTPLTPERFARKLPEEYRYRVYHFTKPKQQIKIIKTGILEDLHEEFNDEIFKVSERDFISAINDPVNCGKLIVALKGKHTYMYYLLGQISAHIINQPD